MSQSNQTFTELNGPITSPGPSSAGDYSGPSIMKEIGNLLRLRQEIDPGSNITNYVRAKMRIVDLIPCDYSLNFKDIGKPGKFAINIEYDKAIGKYSKQCGLYGLTPASGLRIYLTDETVASESFSQEYEANVVETALNKLADGGKYISGIRKIGKSLGSDYDNLSEQGSGYAKKLTKQAGDALVKGFQDVSGVKDNAVINEISDQISGLAGTAAEMLLLGKKISLPRIWTNSSYSTNLALNVNLVSPYGHPAAINEYITKPLIHLLLLGVPRSKDGLSYGLAYPLRVKAYGICDINLGAITSISIQRGGPSSAAYNQYQQPLSIVVRMNIEPLARGFAAMEDTPDIAFLDGGSRESFSGSNEALPAITTIGNIINSLKPSGPDIARYQKTGNQFGDGSGFGDVGSGLTGVSDNLGLDNSSSILDSVSSNNPQIWGQDGVMTADQSAALGRVLDRNNAGIGVDWNGVVS